MAVDKDVYEFHIIYNTEKAFITLKGMCHQKACAIKLIKHILIRIEL